MFSAAQEYTDQGADQGIRVSTPTFEGVINHPRFHADHDRRFRGVVAFHAPVEVWWGEYVPLDAEALQIIAEITK